MTKTQTIVYQDDTIELMHNDAISSRQYLVRLTGWNNYYDFRASKDELKDLATKILLFIGDSSDDI